MAKGEAILPADELPAKSSEESPLTKALVTETESTKVKEAILISDGVYAYPED